MVDALRAARRALRPRGLLVDARPDSRVLARVVHDGRTVGRVATQRGELADDRASDRAVATVKRERLFRCVRAGRFWHRLEFADRAELETYLVEHLRFEHRVRWIASPRARRSWRDDPFALLRAVRYEVLERR